jgi:hypothetical protein
MSNLIGSSTSLTIDQSPTLPPGHAGKMVKMENEIKRINERYLEACQKNSFLGLRIGLEKVDKLIGTLEKDQCSDIFRYESLNKLCKLRDEISRSLSNMVYENIEKIKARINEGNLEDKNRIHGMFAEVNNYSACADLLPDNNMELICDELTVKIEKAAKPAILGFVLNQGNSVNEIIAQINEKIKSNDLPYLLEYIDNAKGNLRIFDEWINHLEDDGPEKENFLQESEKLKQRILLAQDSIADLWDDVRDHNRYRDNVIALISNSQS